MGKKNLDRDILTAILNLVDNWQLGKSKALLESLAKKDLDYVGEFLQIVEKSFLVSDFTHLARLELVLEIGKTVPQAIDQYFDRILSLLSNIQVKSFEDFSDIPPIIDYYKYLTDREYYHFKIKECFKDEFNFFRCQNVLSLLITDKFSSYFDYLDEEIEYFKIPSVVLKKYYKETPIEGIFLHTDYHQIQSHIFEFYTPSEIIEKPFLRALLPLLTIGEKNYFEEYRDKILLKYSIQKPLKYKSLIQDLEPLIASVLIDLLEEDNFMAYDFDDHRSIFKILYVDYIRKGFDLCDDDLTCWAGRFDDIQEFYLIMRNFDVLFKPIIALLESRVKKKNALKPFFDVYDSCKELVGFDDVRNLGIESSELRFDGFYICWNMAEKRGGGFVETVEGDLIDERWISPIHSILQFHENGEINWAETSLPGESNKISLMNKINRNYEREKTTKWFTDEGYYEKGMWFYHLTHKSMHEGLYFFDSAKNLNIKIKLNENDKFFIAGDRINLHFVDKLDHPKGGNLRGYLKLRGFTYEEVLVDIKGIVKGNSIQAKKIVDNTKKDNSRNRELEIEEEMPREDWVIKNEVDKLHYEFIAFNKNT